MWKTGFCGTQKFEVEFTQRSNCTLPDSFARVVSILASLHPHWIFAALRLRSISPFHCSCLYGIFHIQ